MDRFITPIIEIRNENNEIYVKRDDLLPFSFGGNKVRIAQEFIKDMKKQDKNCVIGYGNVKSNLNRALANLCYRENIPCHIISPFDEEGIRIDTFNSRIVQSCKAVFHYCSKSNVKNTIEAVLKNLEKEGLKPYYIYGDSMGKGNEHTPLAAYIKVYEEIKNQYDYIFLATGTGMTQGGLLAGKAQNNGKEKIIGISIARNSNQARQVLKNTLEMYSEKVKRIDIPEIVVLEDYLCGGYGKYNRAIEKNIAVQMQENGIPLDPTYTGKAFYGMLDYLKKKSIKNKKVLFIHTGGMPFYFDYLQGLHLSEVSNIDLITNAIIDLEKSLLPSLSQRNINLKDYAEKLGKSGKVWCHYDMGKPISIIAGYFNDIEERRAYLALLAVDTNYRRKHLAISLISEFEEYALQKGMEKVKLEVRKNNDSAQALYCKFGYKIIGEASENSYYMEKCLEKLREDNELSIFLRRVNHLFPISLSEKEALSELADKFIKKGTISVIREENRIISLCAGYANDDLNKRAYISVVATLPEYADKGYGRIVVQNFICKARQKGMKAVHLYAVKENIPAIKMYENLGFEDFVMDNETRPEDKHFILYL